MAVKHRILLLGGRGQLGKVILKSKQLKEIFSPNKKQLNILNKKKIKEYIFSKKINLIINCAAKARMDYCEKFPKRAFKVNVDGVSNIVNAIKDTNIKFVHFSSDAVYGFNSTNNREIDHPEPFNTYGLTKVCSEYFTKELKNYIIIRTRFYISKKKFNSYAIDMVNSAIDINRIPKIIKTLIDVNFNGIINIGDKTNNNYNRVVKNNSKISKTNWYKIISNKKYLIAKKCTMNLNKMKSIIGNKID